MGTQSQNSEPNFLLVNRNSIFRRVETGLTAIAAGKFVVVADNADREDEGDLILAAEKATPEALAFMIRYTSGIVSCHCPVNACANSACRSWSPRIPSHTARRGGRVRLRPNRGFPRKPRLHGAGTGRKPRRW